MNNAERVAAYITKNGADNLKIDTIPKQRFWIISERIASGLWQIAIADPQKEDFIVVGEVNGRNYQKLITQIIEINATHRIKQKDFVKTVQGELQNILKNSTNTPDNEKREDVTLLEYASFMKEKLIELQNDEKIKKALKKTKGRRTNNKNKKIL